MGEFFLKKTLIFIFLSSPEIALSGSVAGTGGSTEITQISNNVELIKQTNEMLSQSTKLKNQLEKQAFMASEMEKQGKSLSRHEWGKTSEDLKKLAEISRHGEALAYSSANLDALFHEKYKGYNAFTREKTGSSKNLSDQYADWSSSHRDGMIGAMKAAHLQQEQFSTEEETMRTIERLSSTAQGRMEAIQAGNMIAAQQVSQVQKLRGLIMSQMQLQSSYLTFEANQKDASKARSHEFFRSQLSEVSVNDGESF